MSMSGFLYLHVRLNNDLSGNLKFIKFCKPQLYNSPTGQSVRVISCIRSSLHLNCVKRSYNIHFSLSLYILVIYCKIQDTYTLDVFFECFLEIWSTDNNFNKTNLSKLTPLFCQVIAKNLMLFCYPLDHRKLRESVDAVNGFNGILSKMHI